MNFSILGKTGLQVSQLGFGGAPLGNQYGEISNAQANRVVHAAINYGINLFDTSTYYGKTLSEERLGKAIEGKRNKIILATKGGRYDLDHFDFTYGNIIAMCEASLKRLKTDVIDIYQLHDIEFGDPQQVEEGIRALYDLKASGKVRFIGVTGYPLHLLNRMALEHDLDVTLSYCHYNLLNDTLNDKLLPTAKARGMGVLNASVSHMGVLTNQGPQPWHPAQAKIKRAGAKAAAYCRQHNVSLAELSLQFALQNSAVDATILGTRTAEELENSIALLDRPIDQDFLAKVQEILAPVHNLSWPSGRLEHHEISSN